MAKESLCEWTINNGSGPGVFETLTSGVSVSANSSVWFILAQRRKLVWACASFPLAMSHLADSGTHLMVEVINYIKPRYTRQLIFWPVINTTIDLNINPLFLFLLGYSSHVFMFWVILYGKGSIVFIFQCLWNWSSRMSTYSTTPLTHPWNYQLLVNVRLACQTLVWIQCWRVLWDLSTWTLFPIILGSKLIMWTTTFDVGPVLSKHCQTLILRIWACRRQKTALLEDVHWHALLPYRVTLQPFSWLK